MTARRRGEAGSATVLVLVLAAGLLVVATAAMAGASVLVAHRRAAGAADLAALAAAEALQPLSAAIGAPACKAAQRISAANAARLTACTVDGLEVTVEVAVDGAAPVVGRWTVSSSARAGPTTPAVR